jgi:hypothetical protein
MSRNSNFAVVNQVNVETLEAKLNGLKDVIAAETDVEKCKYLNGYSADEKWWVYIEALKVINKYNIKVNNFEICSDGKIEINIEKNHSYSLCPVEISEEEYKTEVRKIFDIVKKGIK